MNDRFKFRAYSKELRKMYEVDTICPYEDNYTKGGEVFLKGIQYNSFYFPEEVEVMQCTGLKDKNGKLIYEGDIVNQIYEDETIYKCEVIYNNCSFQLKHIEDKYKNNINTPMYCYAINYLGHYTEKRLEVIGNIYENKSLLESEG